MKRNFTTLLVFIAAILLNVNAFAQRQCVTHEHRTTSELELSEMQIREFIQNNGHLQKTTYTIPVNVIVVYANSQQNISLAQIQSQIDQLNVDFAGTNADFNPPTEFAAVASGATGITFELVNVERHADSRTSWGTNDEVKAAYPPTTPTTVINMWVANIGGGILGYAQFPGGSPATDGVVMSPQYFGSSNYGNNFYLDAPYDKGRTTTHEVGHWLNLRHIWGDGGCNADDFVDDTPLAGGANYGCPSYPTNSCKRGSGNDMTMNYMDYTDDNCMYMFSAGQKARMLAALSANGVRSSFGGGGTTPPGGGGGSTVCASVSNISGARRSYNYYTVDVPAGATLLNVTTSASNGDADLYVRFGSDPTTRKSDGKSETATSNENVIITNPSAGTWHIGIYGYADYSGLTLDVCYDGPAARMTNSLNAAGKSTEMDSELNLYPSPATDVIHVTSKLQDAVTADIYNINGALVKSAMIEGTNSSISISDLTPGIYTLKVNGEKGIITERFIKQ